MSAVSVPLFILQRMRQAGEALADRCYMYFLTIGDCYYQEYFFRDFLEHHARGAYQKRKF